MVSASLVLNFVDELMAIWAVAGLDMAAEALLEWCAMYIGKENFFLNSAFLWWLICGNLLALCFSWFSRLFLTMSHRLLSDLERGLSCWLGRDLSLGNRFKLAQRLLGVWRDDKNWFLISWNLFKLLISCFFVFYKICLLKSDLKVWKKIEITNFFLFDNIKKSLIKLKSPLTNIVIVVVVVDIIGEARRNGWL